VRTQLEQQRFGLLVVFGVGAVGRQAQVVQGDRQHFRRRVEHGHTTLAEFGQDAFWRALVDTLRLLVPLDNALVAVMRSGRVPRLLIDFDSKGSGDEHEELADYSAGIYLLDPFYQAACAGIADDLHSLEEQGRLICVRDWVLAAMRRHLQLLPPEGSAPEALAEDLVTLLSIKKPSKKGHQDSCSHICPHSHVVYGQMWERACSRRERLGPTA
jgi:hypothetical protein